MPFADVDPIVLAVVAATLVVGAAVQGLVGLGLGLVAAPVTMLLEPALMPDLLLWLAMLYPLVTLAREHDDIDWRGLAWSVAARVPGTAVGVYLLTDLLEPHARHRGGASWSWCRSPRPPESMVRAR